MTNELIREEYGGIDIEAYKALVLTQNGGLKSSEYSSNLSRTSRNTEMGLCEQGIDSSDETDNRSSTESRYNNFNSLTDNLDNIGDQNNTSTDTWHGSITTSTDTLVPTRDLEYTNGYNINSNNNNHNNNRLIPNISRSSSVASSNSSNGRQNNIQPEIHCSSVNSRLQAALMEDNFNGMEDSIQIRPEHHKLEISSSGSIPITAVNRRRRISSQSSSNSNKTNDFVNLKAVNGR